MPDPSFDSNVRPHTTSNVEVQVLPHLPNAAGMYIHRTPAWLVWTFRLSMLTTSVVTSVLTIKGWTTMPTPAKLLAVAIAAPLLAFSLWQRPWNSLVKFAADARGLYFPHNSQLVLHISRPISAQWLFVPWRRVENLRLSTESGGEGGTCIAFDLRVSESDRQDFFGHVGTPRDRPTASAQVVFASYDDSPPRPAKTLQILLSLYRSEA